MSARKARPGIGFCVDPLTVRYGSFSSRLPIIHSPQRPVDIQNQSTKDANMHWIDPAHLPETNGTVDRFLLNPHGDADGLLLTDGMEVHFPPHMSKQVVAALKSGDKVKIRGIRPRGAEMVAAVSLEAIDGKQIIDQGPPKEGPDHKPGKKHATDAHKPMDVEGVVKHVLHGPRGEKRGALLEDGRIVRIPPHAADLLHELLAPGKKLAVRGEGLTNALGTVVDAHEISASLAHLRPVEPKKPHEHAEHKHGKHDEHATKHAPAA